MDLFVILKINTTFRNKCFVLASHSQHHTIDLVYKSRKIKRENKHLTIFNKKMFFPYI